MKPLGYRWVSLSIFFFFDSNDLQLGKDVLAENLYYKTIRTEP